MNDTARAAPTLRRTATSAPSRSHTPWWIWTLAAVGVLGLLAFTIVIGIMAVPAALANLRTQVASVHSPLVLGSGPTSVEVVVPDGWLITRPDDSHALITTPDGGMTVDVDLDAEAPADAATTAGVASPLVEVLASGLTAAHGSPVPTSEDDPADVPALVAAVGPVAGGSIVFSVSTADLDRYRPALANLLEGVRP